MASPGSSSSSSASARPSRVLPWVLLSRVARLDGAATGNDDVVVKLVAPPGICTAIVDAFLAPPPFIHRTLLPIVEHADYIDNPTTPFYNVINTAPLPIVGDRRYTAPCRVEGADASGRLLLAFPSPRSPGDSHLLTCRLVASGSGDAAKATGKTCPVRAFPDAPGLALAPAAPTGILSDLGSMSGDGGFNLAQFQGAPSSSSVARVLCYSRDTDCWSVQDVPVEERWRDFATQRVVSHDRGVRGDAALLVFVDINRGILLFHPRLPGATYFIDLPAAAHGGGNVVESIDGKILYLNYVDTPDGRQLVRSWCLCEEERRWIHADDLPSDDLLLCHRQTTLVWPLSHGVSKSTWKQSAKQAGKMAVDVLQSSRDKIHFLPIAAEILATLNLPMTGALVSAAQTAVTINNYIGECEKLWPRQPAAPPEWEQFTTVATEQEALMAIEVWNANGQPPEMKARPASGITDEQVEFLRDVFICNGAQRLIVDDTPQRLIVDDTPVDFVIVPPAPRF